MDAWMRVPFSIIKIDRKNRPIDESQSTSIRISIHGCAKNNIPIIAAQFSFRNVSAFAKFAVLKCPQVAHL